MENHLNQVNDQEMEEGDEAGWNNWEAESADSSDSGSWIDVESDDNAVIEVSDDEGDLRTKLPILPDAGGEPLASLEAPDPMLTLAATKVQRG